MATDGFEGARTDVTSLECIPEDDKWQASGEVRNSADDTVHYRIYLSFTDEASVTRGLLEIDTDDVQPGKTSDFRGELDVAGDGLTCVARVERVKS